MAAEQSPEECPLQVPASLLGSCQGGRASPNEMLRFQNFMLDLARIYQSEGWEKAEEWLARARHAS